MITIDFRAIVHAIRRWWWQLTNRRPVKVFEACCSGCGKQLTDKEKFYYIIHCERCEGIYMQQMDRL